jgi:hypothetical protein
MVPSQGRAYRFTDCGISYEDVPDFGASPHSILPLPAYKDNNWQVPLIVGGILTSWLGGYYNGMGEGLATIEAYNRTSEGYHFRSSRSHFLRDQGTIGYAIGFSSIAIGMYQHESQLRKTSHNNDFWHSAKPLPTICRSLLISGITAGGSHLFAQWGYHRYVK